MDTETLSAILNRQFERSWRMFREAVEALSAEEWRASEIQYLTPARTAYHVVETAEFYSSDTPDGFPWAHRFGYDWEAEVEPEQLPTQDDILSYLADVRPQVQAWIDRVDLSAPDAAFSWTGGAILDRALYLLRHNHHHVGEMWSEIKRRGHDLPDWH